SPSRKNKHEGLIHALTIAQARTASLAEHANLLAKRVSQRLQVLFASTDGEHNGTAVLVIIMRVRFLHPLIDYVGFSQQCSELKSISGSKSKQFRSSPT